MLSSLGGFEPPTFRLTAERANRLRHRDRDRAESLFRLRAVSDPCRATVQAHFKTYMICSVIANYLIECPDCCYILQHSSTRLGIVIQSVQICNSVVFHFPVLPEGLGGFIYNCHLWFIYLMSQAEEWEKHTPEQHRWVYDDSCLYLLSFCFNTLYYCVTLGTMRLYLLLICVFLCDRWQAVMVPKPAGSYKDDIHQERGLWDHWKVNSKLTVLIYNII